MKKILFGLYVSIMLLGVTIDDVMAQADIKVSLTMDKGGCALTGNGYLLNDPFTNLPEPIKIGITLENVGGGPVIVTKGFINEAFHLLLAFRGPDSQLIKSKPILYKGLPPSITKTEPPKEILVDGVLTQVDPVDTLPANWIFSTTLPNAYTFYDLISAGSGVYSVDPIIPIRTYSEIIATIGGIDYAVLEPALFEGNVPNKGNSLEFCVIADEDGDNYSFPIAKVPPATIALPANDQDVLADCDDRPEGEDRVAGTIDDGININPGMTELPGDGLNNDCDFSTLDRKSLCTFGRPKNLIMVYNGLDCNAMSHSQSSGVTCTDFGQLPSNPGDQVWIEVNDRAVHNQSQTKTYFKGYVDLYNNEAPRTAEETIDALASEAGLARFKGGTVVHIFDTNGLSFDAEGHAIGTKLQQVSFHTSCSDPLFTGDQFGGVLVFDGISESGCCGDVSEEDIALIALIESSINSSDLKTALNDALPLSDCVLNAAINRSTPMNSSDLKDVLLNAFPLTECVLRDIVFRVPSMNTDDNKVVLIDNSPLPTSILNQVIAGNPPMDSEDLVAVLDAQ